MVPEPVTEPRRVIDENRQINDVFHPGYRSKHRWLILWGGAGSGKSRFAAQKFILRSIKEDNHKLVATRKVGTSLRDSVFAELCLVINDWGLESLWHIKEGDMRFEYLPNNNKILCKGLDDVDKMKSIVNITSMWHEEPNQMTNQDLRQLNLRMRGLNMNYKQHALTFNPVNVDSHLKRQFFDREVESCLKIHSTYHDNAYLDAEYERELEALADVDPMFHAIYARGQWGVLGDLVYGHMPRKAYPGEPWSEFYGLDFGFMNPTGLVKVGRVEEDFYLKQMLYQTRLTNPQLIERMKQLRVPYLGLYPGLSETSVASLSPIYCDNAEPARIEEIRLAGFNALPADKAVRAGIDAVKGRRVYTNDDNDDLNTELAGYKWRVTKDGVTLDEPVKFNDHLVDAMRYAIFTHARGRLPEHQSYEIYDLESELDEFGILEPIG